MFDHSGQSLNRLNISLKLKHVKVNINLFSKLSDFKRQPLGP